ncbi:Transmembrane protein 71 [Dissostichus eleginoides]|uniref:Transmembrane protein 71 n=1 Tax=Dissostichus eleginoides TaxID=100907 RepID=A0AAD9EUD4_DISEL|nr:Transmembrane protein 71 [Dissostichus eleginoides]
MSLFFSGAVTSSPIKRRLRGHSCQSLDVSLLSPDSSYVCYSSLDGDPSSCRRSPRLLTNGYYSVTEDSFSWDEKGNVSLTPCKTSVSYKENLVRVFRRRRRPRGSLARLLSDVTESCQSWLDEKVFRGVFDHTEIPPPPDKVALPPKILIQEEICSEICQSKFTQSLGGLSEVPPPSPFYTNSCCPASAEHTGLTMKALLLFIFTLFLFTALYSGCLLWSATVTSTVFLMITSFMLLTKSGPLGEWRRAKTEDITSRNE